jgi:hypothetical protein
MDCAKVRKHLSDYVDGRLSDRLKKSVDDHLRHCPGCREELTALKALRRKMGGLHRMSAPPGFLDRVHRRLESEGTQTRKKQRRVFFLPAGVPVGVAALATAAAAFIFVINVIIPRLEERPRSVDITASRERAPSAVEERAAPHAEPEATVSEDEAEPAGGGVSEQAKVDIGDRESKAQSSEVQIPETREEFTAMRALGADEEAPAPLYMELVLHVQPEGSVEPYTPPAERGYGGDSERDQARAVTGFETAKKEMDAGLRSEGEAAPREGGVQSVEEAGEASLTGPSILDFIENLARDFGGDILSLDYGEREDIPRSVTAEIPVEAVEKFSEALTRAGDIERVGDTQDVGGWTGLVRVRILLNSQTEE